MGREGTRAAGRVSGSLSSFRMFEMDAPVNRENGRSLRMYWRKGILGYDNVYGGHREHVV